jgi:hypothetical protein
MCLYYSDNLYFVFRAGLNVLPFQWITEQNAVITVRPYAARDQICGRRLLVTIVTVNSLMHQHALHFQHRYTSNEIIVYALLRAVRKARYNRVRL